MNRLERSSTATSTVSTYNSTSGSGSFGYDMSKTNSVRSVGFLKLRGMSDDLPQSWWFASTAIPLLAATTGPMSNVLSIAALVSPWRVVLPNNGQLPDGTDDAGVGIPDPHWEIILNACSLAFGFAGNFFLLLNFTGRVRYIISLPLSIIFWLLASGILMGITISMHLYVPPVGPGEIYSQGYWYAVFAATFYVLGCFMLMANMVGYALGHYPQKFDIDEHQRTLILQTMMFFFWLAAGAGIFVRLEGWEYADALYLCDVAVLTVGFGDFAPETTQGRGFLFVFELLGIIQLGLAISSISKFVSNMSRDKVIKSHQRHMRETTIGRTVTSEKELRDRLGLPPRRASQASIISNSSRPTGDPDDRYGRLEVHGRTVTWRENKAPAARGGGRGGASRSMGPALSRDAKMQARSNKSGVHERRHRRRQKLVLLEQEKDRFDAMREIQDETRRFKQYYSLGSAVLAWGVLWCIGALVFFYSEHRLQDLSYFDALYFCFVSLLTIGFGDISPKSNIGKPFFVIWSLIAVPTMTILIQEMSSTVVAAINRGTFALADWTVMPKKGVFREFIEHQPRLMAWLQARAERRKEQRRLRAGFQVQNPDEENPNLTAGASRTEPGPTAEETERNRERVVREASKDHHDLARELALAIKKVAHDLSSYPPVRYSYEQWVHFTLLIRFSTRSRDEVEALEDEEGLVEWDWIGEDSPMLADVTEAQWVLDRLCESLNRYTRRQASKEERLTVLLKAAKKNKPPPASKSATNMRDLPHIIHEEDEDRQDGPSTSTTEHSSTTVVDDREADQTEDGLEIKLWAQKMGSREACDDDNERDDVDPDYCEPNKKEGDDAEGDDGEGGYVDDGDEDDGDEDGCDEDGGDEGGDEGGDGEEGDEEKEAP